MRNRMFVKAVLLIGCAAVWAAMLHAVWTLDSSAAQQPGRSKDDIQRDLQTTTLELRSMLSSPAVLFDEKKRAEIAPRMVPVMKKTLGLFEELAAADEVFKLNFDATRRQFLAMLSLMGDGESSELLARDAASPDAARAVPAKAAQLVVRWWKNPKSAQEQGKVLDEVSKLAKEAPENEGIVEAVAAMHQQGTATPELRKRLEGIVTNELKGESARQMTESIQAEAKLREAEGKPMVLEGVLADGRKFSTADWKGKVVLVDFWATWCGPCIAELPRVKKTYAEFHPKGLEIVGVSCDQDADSLKTFLERNKDMPWPQMFDASKPGWHALATQYGVNGIPTMFLIDRKGICRTVKARENFEEMIPKLLAEKAD